MKISMKFKKGDPLVAKIRSALIAHYELQLDDPRPSVVEGSLPDGSRIETGAGLFTIKGCTFEFNGARRALHSVLKDHLIEELKEADWTGTYASRAPLQWWDTVGAATDRWLAEAGIDTSVESLVKFASRDTNWHAAMGTPDYILEYLRQAYAWRMQCA